MKMPLNIGIGSSWTCVEKIKTDFKPILIVVLIDSNFSTYQIHQLL